MRETATDVRRESVARVEGPTLRTYPIGVGELTPLVSDHRSGCGVSFTKADHGAVQHGDNGHRALFNFIEGAVNGAGSEQRRGCVVDLGDLGKNNARRKVIALAVDYGSTNVLWQLSEERPMPSAIIRSIAFRFITRDNRRIAVSPRNSAGREPGRLNCGVG